MRRGLYNFVVLCGATFGLAGCATLPTEPATYVPVQSEPSPGAEQAEPAKRGADGQAKSQSETVRIARVRVTDMPVVLAESQPTATRKRIFIRVVLPLVLEANEAIQQDRHHLSKIMDGIESGRLPDVAEWKWLDEAADRYRVKKGDFEALLHRMDVVPPSLAIAQAAIESGWGRSRFAQEGNALFGQWTWSEAGGIVPSNRPKGKTHSVKAFPSVFDSVRDYIHNLNTHAAYRSFREERARLRANERTLRGLALTDTLIRYSERREAYVRDLDSIIQKNELWRFDAAILEPREATLQAGA